MVDHEVLDRRQIQVLAQTIKRLKDERTKHPTKGASEGTTKTRSKTGGA
jgi:hypothetical protein